MKMLRARGKIVLLATHQLQYLVHADRILLMDGGKISTQGSYESLKQSGFDFAELLKKFNVEEQQISLNDSAEINAPLPNGSASFSHEPSPKVGSKPRHISAKNKNADLQANKEQDEERKLGGISKKVYSAYFLRQPVWWIIAGISVFLYRALDLAQNFWVARWASAVSGTSNATATAPEALPNAFASLAFDSPLSAPADFAPATSNSETRFYLTVYTILTLVGSLAMLAQEALIAFAGLKSGRLLYDRMVSTLIRAKMDFFDVTPKGRIMARVSHDTDQVDNAIAGLISTFANTVLQMIGTLVVIFASTTWFLVALVPLVIIYARIYLLFIRSFRETARLQSISKAPIFSVFSETLNGLFTIRAFKSESRFQRQIEERINANQRPYLYGFTTNRWLGMRMDFISGLITQTLATVAIFGRGSVSAPLIGVAITYSLLSNEFLNGLIRSMSDLEGKMNNVERMDQYALLETEPPAIIRTHRPPSLWPSQGSIEFQNVKMRYREGLPLVLNGLSFTIKPREKIGIVGRTGAGKSTLTTALFRLADLAEGRILIDGIDISSIGVKDLRSKLAIIPQDPVIFDGSIRRNLDPSETTSDDDLWSVLQRVHLRDAVTSMGGLDAPLAEEGSNMSAGQRQLLCIGRALLRKAKILLLDEASSSIDMETDYLLQQTIRREFADCTVLTIAHRLQTSTPFPNDLKRKTSYNLSCY
jgi:ATP-binding cassette, subfamily C (CFTR/MRP), member 1